MDVQKFLKDQGVEFEVTRHEQAFSAQEVAAAEHVTGHMFAKTVIVKGGGNTYMLVLPASRHVDLKAAGELVGAKLKMVSEEALKTAFPDCEIGAEPPFGSQYGLPTYVDASLEAREEIVFRAGTHDRTVRMRYSDYARLEAPTVAEFAVQD